MILLLLILFLATIVTAGCSGGDDGDEMVDAMPSNAADAMPGSPDAMVAAVQIPGWTLEDVNTSSPTAGQVIGLDEFSGSILVATLVESG